MARAQSKYRLREIREEGLSCDSCRMEAAAEAEQSHAVHIFHTQRVYSRGISAISGRKRNITECHKEIKAKKSVRREPSSMAPCHQWPMPDCKSFYFNCTVWCATARS